MVISHGRIRKKSPTKQTQVYFPSPPTFLGRNDKHHNLVPKKQTTSFYWWISFWLVVSTHLKKCSSNWIISNFRAENKKHLRNHHLVMVISKHPIVNGLVSFLSEPPSMVTPTRSPPNTFLQLSCCGTSGVETWRCCFWAPIEHLSEEVQMIFILFIFFWEILKFLNRWEVFS